MRWLGWIVLAMACGPAVTDGPGGNESGGDDDSDDDDGDDSDDEESGDPDEPVTPGPDGKIDCLDVPASHSTVGGSEPGALGFPVSCNPRLSGSGEWTCCSDDPAAVGGELPAYQGKDIDGNIPYFADVNNAVGTWGMCVRTGDIPAGSGLQTPSNCPIPCNPTWDDTQRQEVCGAGRQCCQTVELQPEDCIMDDDGTWRPVRGTDIGLGTNWANEQHATHQDPGGVGCSTFADSPSDAWEDCVRQLGVADQRGFCMALTAGQVCPAAAPGYLDACEQINMGIIPPPG
jgi:hypothetical protein